VVEGGGPPIPGGGRDGRWGVLVIILYKKVEKNVKHEYR